MLILDLISIFERLCEINNSFLKIILNYFFEDVYLNYQVIILYHRAAKIKRFRITLACVLNIDLWSGKHRYNYVHYLKFGATGYELSTS